MINFITKETFSLGFFRVQILRERYFGMIFAICPFKLKYGTQQYLTSYIVYIICMPKQMAILDMFSTIKYHLNYYFLLCFPEIVKMISGNLLWLLGIVSLIIFIMAMWDLYSTKRWVNNLKTSWNTNKEEEGWVSSLVW